MQRPCQLPHCIFVALQHGDRTALRVSDVEGADRGMDAAGCKDGAAVFVPAVDVDRPVYSLQNLLFNSVGWDVYVMYYLPAPSISDFVLRVEDSSFSVSSRAVCKASTSRSVFFTQLGGCQYLLVKLRGPGTQRRREPRLARSSSHSWAAFNAPF